MAGDTSRDGRRGYEPLALLDYIDVYQRNHANRSPSQHHLRVGLDIGAPSVVYTLLHGLTRDGLLTITLRGSNAPAELVITAAGHERLRQVRLRDGAADPSPEAEGPS